MRRTLMTALLLCLTAGAWAQSELERNFQTPPASARPYTWWHWMNGNASKEGITADLEAMAAAGVGGVQAFNINIMEKGPVDYASKEWYELMNHAMRECQRLGLEFDMHNCPGWSSTGGFWITPEQAGKQISWSEAYVSGGKKVDMSLPQPTGALGSYWDDIVIAWPSTRDESLVEKHLKSATIDGTAVDPALISMNAQHEFRFSKELLLEFDAPVSAQTLRGFIKNDMPEPSEADLQQIRQGFGRPQSGPAPSISFSEDGQNWTQPRDISVLPGAVSYAAFPETFFRYAKITPRTTVILRGLQLSGAPMDDGFLRNADYEMSAGGGGGFGGPMGRQAGPAAAKQIAADQLIDPKSVIDLSGYVNDGRLIWDAPEGDWTILRLGYVPVDRHTKMGSAVGDGLEIDKFSKEALQYHFDWLYPQLMAELEKSAGSVGAGMLIDSYECGNSNWTPKMREEFRTRRGYDMTGYLPALVGKYVGSEDVSGRFLWDFRRTCADLFADNYAGYFADLLHQHGILLYNEPYNSSVFDEMQVGTRADIPMGEFWVRTHQDRWTLKMASSIAHVNGKRVGTNQVVGAESFTGWQPDAGWQNFPYSLKAQGDDAWTMGLNRFIFHRFAHQPNVNVAPGMSMGNIGFHFDRTNTWFEQGSAWLKYAARAQYLLQQGAIVADVLYLVSEDVPGGSHSAWNPELPYGYWGDQANAEMFLDAVKLDGGDLLSADGAVRYRMLLLQNVQGRKMTLQVLRKIDQYVSAGGTVCGMAPTTTPNLSSEAELREFEKLKNKLWGGIERGGVKQVGRGRVCATLNVQEALDAVGITPDVEYSYAEDAPVNFIHRNVAGTDVYFLANHRRTSENLTVTFRAGGKRPELWDAATGEIIKPDVYDVLPDGRVRVPIHFDPVGSWFVVFREQAGTHYAALTRDGETVISTAPYAERKGGFYPDVKDNFTISVWIRPETDSGVPNNAGVSSGSTWGGNANSYPYVLGDPEQLYGPGNAVAGIVATRLGVSVVQRGGMPAQQPGRGGPGGPGGPGGMPMGMPGMGGGGAQPVISAMDKLGGWHHVAAVYRDGVPSLYIDGELKATGSKATASVHPTYKDVAVANNNIFFEGDFAEYQVLGRALSDADIRAAFAQGAPKALTAFEPAQAAAGGWYLFEDGLWNIGDKSLKVKGLPAPKDLTANIWQVAFQEKRGAPAQITLDGLMPLQQHPDDGVKYFSGTATYKTSFTVKKNELKGRALFLDLGQVYVIASVRLNGKDLGVLWKAPYRVEITDAVKSGENILEVEVANLWTNRLIGDAQTPSLYESTGRDGNRLPDWYLRGEAKPEGDGKVVYTVADFYAADEPLYDSGLVGPVVIRSAVRMK